jgi:hypothetical protein
LGGYGKNDMIIRDSLYQSRIPCIYANVLKGTLTAGTVAVVTGIIVDTEATTV